MEIMGTKIIKVAAYVSTGYVGCDRNEEVEVYLDDTMNEQEIEQAKADTVREWMYEQIDWGWVDIDEEE